MIIKIALVGLAFCAGFVSAQPSTAEFNLFCRILAKANDMMYGPDYVYDENVDRETIQEMTVLYNATTDDMNEFRKTLWDTKDFFEEHPPPAQPESRIKAHREIGNLIKEGEKKIEENRGLAEKVNEIIKEAKLSVAQGIFGGNVTVVPKEDGNITEILSNVKSIFNHDNSPSSSCGGKGKDSAGKTLLNDFFCVCVGSGVPQSAGPCTPHILPPQNGGGNNGWKAMKYKTSSNEKKTLQFKESFKQIEKACAEELVREVEPVKDMDALLDEYVGMIWDGTAEKGKGKKIFGHSGRQKKEQVETCDGSGYSGIGYGKDAANAQICVDYANHTQDGKTYDIPWHEKFKSYSTFMKDTKKIEERILKNRADLLLLKSQAWIAYNRETDDETTNLDDMNVSNLFDATQPPPSFPSFPFLFLLS